jgi:hypothetical protein
MVQPYSPSVLQKFAAELTVQSQQPFTHDQSDARGRDELIAVQVE